MAIRIARGLFRLWVVLAVLWIAVFSTVYYDSYNSLERKNRLQSNVHFNDQVTRYKHCWDYQAPDGKKVDLSDLSKISDEALLTIYNCHLSTDRSHVVKVGVLITIGIPLLVLILGYALVWVGRGFIASA
ncbi:MAG TPA: hypothetical protein PKB01_03835 [Xanthobacteraceae bacterium]|nr:hypothetical protein [Xanthobacteraceae bacterium]